MHTQATLEELVALKQLLTEREQRLSASETDRAQQTALLATAQVSNLISLISLIALSWRQYTS